MEKWDLYDVNREKTGETAVRGERLPEGRYHLVVHACIMNGDGRMLIQRRQLFKAGYPGLWDVSMGGSAVAGDSSIRAAEREVKEELGLTIDLTGCLPALTIPFEYGFDDFYLVGMSPRLEELTLQPEEVMDAAWAGEEEIIAMIREGTFIPYREALIRLLFDIWRGGEGAHRA